MYKEWPWTQERHRESRLKEEKMAMVFSCFKPHTDDDSDSATRADHRRGSNEGSSHDNKVVGYVELLRRTNEPLGLVLKGGADEGRPVWVSALRPGGVAEKSGALQVGDQILCINGTATEHLVHTEVEALVQNAGNVINLEILYEPPPGTSLNDGMQKKTATIDLSRERNSFGFTISGGRTDGHPITVSNVTVGSGAFRNGILKAGDRILKVNGADVSHCSQMETLSLLKASADTCTLEIEYDVPLHEGLLESRGPLHVELQKPKGSSLGIRLTPQDGTFWISNVKEAGNADRCGALHKGDQLLSVNSVSVASKTIREVMHMLVHSDLQVKLEIIPAHNFSGDEVLELRSEDAVSDSLSISSRTPSNRSASHSIRQSQLSLSSVATSTHLLSHPETMEIQLKVDSIGFGLSLQGGAHDYRNFPLTISSIEEGGPAARLGQLQVGDRVLAINGVRTEGITLQQAVKLVQESGDMVDMEIEFDVQDNIVPSSGTFEVKMMKTASLNLGITINGSHQHGHSIWIAKLKKGGIACRMGMLQPGDILLTINGQSLANATLHDAAHLLKTSGDIVTLKVSKDTHTEGRPETLIYTVELFRHGQSLGVTLSGSKDATGQPIVISHIRKGGVADRTGRLRAGDRIMAINGESLFGKTLPEAVNMLHSAGDIVKLRMSKPRARLRPKPGSPGKAYRYVNHDSGLGIPRTGSYRLNALSPHRLPRVNSRSSSVHLSGMRRRLSSTTIATTVSGSSTPDNSSIGPPPRFPVQDHTSAAFHHDRDRSLYLNYRSRDLEGGGGDEGKYTALGHHPGASAFSKPSILPPRERHFSSLPHPGGLLESNFRSLRQRDSLTETDEEMSHEEDEAIFVRRGSVPARLGPSYPRDSREYRWNFKPRQGAAALKIPIGRVSPLTPVIPSSTNNHTPSSTPSSLKFRAELKIKEDSVDPISNPSIPPSTDSPDPKLLLQVKEPPDQNSDLENAAKAASELTTKVPLTAANESRLDPKKIPPLSVAMAGGSSGDIGETDRCLKEMENTLLNSGRFMDQLRQIAESGSSDQDSDCEPHKSEKFPPHLHEQILKQMRIASTPTKTDITTVVLKRDGAADFGFSVSDGLLEPGVYIKKIRPGGPADLSGELRAFDKIIKINDVVVQDYDCCKCVPLLAQLGEEVTLYVARNTLASHKRTS